MSAFTQESLDRLTQLLGEVSARPMFGGYGFYRNDRIFGCVMRDDLYLKTDDQTRDTFLAAGAKQMTNDVVQKHTNRRMSMPYYLADPQADHFAGWVQLAVAAAERSSSKAKKGKG